MLRVISRDVIYEKEAILWKNTGISVKLHGQTQVSNFWYLMLEDIESKYCPRSIYTWDEMADGRSLEECNRHSNIITAENFLRRDLFRLTGQLVLLNTVLLFRIINVT